VSEAGDPTPLAPQMFHAVQVKVNARTMSAEQLRRQDVYWIQYDNHILLSDLRSESPREEGCFQKCESAQSN
jgi:hypothetical protein